MNDRFNRLVAMLNYYIECNDGQELLCRFTALTSGGRVEVNCKDKYNIQVIMSERNGDYRGCITFDDIEHAATFLSNLDIDMTSIVSEGGIHVEDKHRDQKATIQWIYGSSNSVYIGFCILCEHATEETINAYYKLLLHYSDIKDTVNRKW